MYNSGNLIDKRKQLEFKNKKVRINKFKRNKSHMVKKKVNKSAYYVPAGLFLGMGIGWIFGYLVPGLLIGMGAGFLAQAILKN